MLRMCILPYEYVVEQNAPRKAIGLEARAKETTNNLFCWHVGVRVGRKEKREFLPFASHLRARKKSTGGLCGYLLRNNP